MSEIDQQFIEFVVKSLVGKPDAVQVKRSVDEKGVLLELTVDPEDLGRVIGKRGATAQSLRTLLRALGTKNDARYNLKIVDNGPGGNSGAKATNDDGQSSTQNDNAAGDDATVEDVEAEVPAAESPADTAEDADATADVEEDKDEDQASDRLRKTRQELADLDDLDV